MKPRAAAYDAIVVGAGHNGLVSAAYLAKAGLRTLVLERAEVVGGAAISEQPWPGWTVSAASYVCSLLHPQIIEDLELRRHGYEAYLKSPAAFTVLPDGRSLLLGRDAAENAREIAAHDPRDVAGYAAFDAERTRLGSALADAFMVPDARDVRLDDATRAAFEGSAADLVERYIHSDILQAESVNDGLIGTYAGPRDPGTGYVLAFHNAGRAHGVQGAWGFVRGGMGAISRAIAASATAAGAEIVTGAPVERVRTAGGRATGVVLADGSEIAARIFSRTPIRSSRSAAWATASPNSTHRASG